MSGHMRTYASCLVLLIVFLSVPSSGKKSYAITPAPSSPPPQAARSPEDLLLGEIREIRNSLDEVKNWIDQLHRERKGRTYLLPLEDANYLIEKLNEIQKKTAELEKNAANRLQFKSILEEQNRKYKSYLDGTVSSVMDNKLTAFASSDALGISLEKHLKKLLKSDYAIATQNDIEELSKSVQGRLEILADSVEISENSLNQVEQRFRDTLKEHRRQTAGNEDGGKNTFPFAQYLPEGAYANTVLNILILLLTVIVIALIAWPSREQKDPGRDLRVAIDEKVKKIGHAVHHLAVFSQEQIDRTVEENRTRVEGLSQRLDNIDTRLSPVSETRDRITAIERQLSDSVLMQVHVPKIADSVSESFRSDFDRIVSLQESALGDLRDLKTTLTDVAPDESRDTIRAYYEELARTTEHYLAHAQPAKSVKQIDAEKKCAHTLSKLTELERLCSRLPKLSGIPGPFKDALAGVSPHDSARFGLTELVRQADARVSPDDIRARLLTEEAELLTDPGRFSQFNPHRPIAWQSLHRPDSLNEVEKRKLILRMVTDHHSSIRGGTMAAWEDFRTRQLLDFVDRVEERAKETDVDYWRKTVKPKILEILEIAGYQEQTIDVGTALFNSRVHRKGSEVAQSATGAGTILDVEKMGIFDPDTRTVIRKATVTVAT